jgi:hypothetical protein
MPPLANTAANPELYRATGRCLTENNSLNGEGAIGQFGGKGKRERVVAYDRVPAAVKIVSRSKLCINLACPPYSE